MNSKQRSEEIHIKNYAMEKNIFSIKEEPTQIDRIEYYMDELQPILKELVDNMKLLDFLQIGNNGSKEN
jgi:hypothetical protein